MAGIEPAKRRREVNMLKHIVKKYNTMSIQLKAAFWYLVCSLLQKGIAVIFTPIFTRLMSTAQYGTFSVYTSWKEIFYIIITLRLSAGVMGPGLIKEDDQNRAAFSSSMQGLSLALVLIWGLVLLAFPDIASNITGLPSILCYVMVLHVWTQAIWELWAKEQRINYLYKKLVILTIIVAVVRPLLGIFVVSHFEEKATARIVEMASVDFFAYIGLFIFTLIRGKTFFSKKYWKYALVVNIPLIPHFLSQTVLNSADRIMIERITGSSEAGIYSLAYSISMITIFLNNSMLQAMSPWTFQKLKNGEGKKIERIGIISLVFVAVVNLVFIALAPELVSLFAPAQYSAAVWIVPPIAMSVFFQFSYLLFADIELYFEKTKYIALATGIGAVLNILLNYICIKEFGYFAAGYTTLACYAIIAIIHYEVMRKTCKEKMIEPCVYSLKKWLFLSVVFVGMGFLLLISYHNTIVRYTIVFGIVVFVVIKRKIVIDFLGTLRK